MILKKSLYSIIALSALASAAQAQTVTVYGNIDPSVMTQSKSGANGDGGRVTSMVDASVVSSFYGLKGTEDLGDGMSAGFVLEGGFNSGNGLHASPGVYQTQVFGREAKVTLGSDWGTVGAGLQLDPALLASISTDPRKDTPSFSNLDFWIHATLGNGGGVASTASGSLQGGIYDDNSLTYTYYKNGLYVGMEYGVGGVAGSTSANSTESIGLSYTNSGFTVSASYAQDKNSKPTVDSDSSQISVFGVGYAWGDFAIRAQYGDFKITPAVYTTVNDDIQSKGIGFDWQTSIANKVNLAYYNVKDAGTYFGGRTTEIALLDTYSLSKHTFIFGQVANLDVGAHAGLSAGLGGFYTPNGATAPNGPFGTSSNSTLYFGVGFNHSF
jgi:predicted porin